jgi:hypothetical protein
VFFGFILFNANWGDPRPNEIAGGQISIFIGVILLMVLCVGAYFDLRPRFREWNVDRKSDEIYIKKKEREIKQKEEQLKRERRRRKEEERRQKEREEARKRAEERAREERYGQERKSQTSTSPPREETSRRAEATGFGSEKQEYKDDAWFGTGTGAPEDLKQKRSEQSETHYSKAEKDQLEKESQSEKDYKYQISLDKHLLLLWTLYRTNEHEFDSRNKLIIATKGDINNRTPWYDAIEDLERKDLIKRINERQRTGAGLEWGERITDLGLSLIKKARYDQVTRWDDFQKKYYEFLRT